MLAVKVEGLGRVYEQRGQAEPVRALWSIDLEVELGQVQGLLGPNGAGKTTLTKILSTVLLPSAGHAAILGHDVVRETAAVRRNIGLVLGGDRGLYPRLTARQNLAYWAALYNVPRRETKARIEMLLERVGLDSDRRIDTYSRGMKQRLHLARGLIADPSVLLLDEPTMGMDPLAARDFRTLIHELRQAGKSILLTTHDMEEAAALCDNVALIDKGRVLATESPERLARLVAKHERIDFSSKDESVPARVRDLFGVASVRTLEQPTTYRVELSDEAALHQVLSFLVSQRVTALGTSRPSLTEVYVHVIGDRGFKV